MECKVNRFNLWKLLQKAGKFAKKDSWTITKGILLEFDEIQKKTFRAGC